MSVSDLSTVIAHTLLMAFHIRVNGTDYSTILQTRLGLQNILFILTIEMRIICDKES